MRFRSLAAAAGATGLLIGMGVPAAQARPPVSVDHFDVSFTDTFADCGLDLYVETSVAGTTTIRPAPSSTEAFLAANQVRATDTIYRDAGDGANPAGDFVKVDSHARFVEQKASLVSGTVYSFQQVENGQFTMYDSDGVRLLRGNYHLKITQIFDTQGDGQPGGIAIETTEVAHENASADYCEALADALT